MAIRLPGFLKAEPHTQRKFEKATSSSATLPIRIHNSLGYYVLLDSHTLTQAEFGLGRFSQFGSLSSHWLHLPQKKVYLYIV